MTSPRVLILCTGNSCRSQIGEGRVRHGLGDRLDDFNRIDAERLHRLEVRLRDAGATDVHQEIDCGRPGPLLVAKARSNRVSLLVPLSGGKP